MGHLLELQISKSIWMKGRKEEDNACAWLFTGTDLVAALGTSLNFSRPFTLFI